MSGTDEYGYDPDRKRRRAMRDLFDRMEETVQASSQGPRQLGAAAGLPTITPVKKRLIAASCAIRQDAPEEITYQHTVLCQTALPVRRPPESVRVWEREQGRAALSLEAGRARDPKTQKFVDLPLPFGPKARLILMHLNSAAIKAQSPIIEVSTSVTAFVSRIQGRAPTGPEIRAFKNQLSALSAATIRLAVTSGERATQINTQIVGAFDLWFPKDANQRVLWPSTVQLSTDYFNSLVNQAVPLDERAIASLAHSALALDVYAWMAQRLHRMPSTKPQLVPWTALYEQFGQGYQALRFFRRDFLKTLSQVKTAYPTARFDADGRGMTLWQSPPPVAKLLVPVSPRTIEHEP